EIDDPHARRAFLVALVTVALVALEPVGRLGVVLLVDLLGLVLSVAGLRLFALDEPSRLEDTLAGGAEGIVDERAVPGELVGAPPDEHDQAEVDGPAEVRRGTAGVLDIREQP